MTNIAFIFLQLIVLIVRHIFAARTLLSISSSPSTWHPLNSCDGTNLTKLCLDSSPYTPCNPDLDSIFNTSQLPQNFAAWLNGYVTYSYTIIYKGCYSPINIRSQSLSTENFALNFTDLVTCGRSCRDHNRYIQDIGILGLTCYCLTDSFTMSQKDFLNEESECGFSSVKVYELKSHDRDLGSDYCPIAYVLPGGSEAKLLDKCDDQNSFYCSGTEDKKRDKASWWDAFDFCKRNQSSTISNAKHENMKYWLNGITFHIYKQSERLPLFSTQCMALISENRQYYLKNIDCYSERPFLICSSGEARVTDEVSSMVLPSEPDMTTRDLMPTQQTDTELSTTKQYTYYIATSSSLSSSSTTQTTTLINDEKEGNSTIVTTVVIIVGIIVLCVIIGVVIAIRRKLGRSEYSSTGGNDGGVNTHLCYTDSTATTPTHVSIQGANYMTADDL